MADIDINQLRKDLFDMVADSLMDLDLKKHLPKINFYINQLNSLIDLVPKDHLTQAYYETVSLCYEFYRLRDDALE